MSRLTVAMVRSLSKPGRYGDGPSSTLYLNVAPGGSKSWVQRLVVAGKRRDIGLGGFPLVTLAERASKRSRIADSRAEEAIRLPGSAVPGRRRSRRPRA